MQLNSTGTSLARWYVDSLVSEFTETADGQRAMRRVNIYLKLGRSLELQHRVAIRQQDAIWSRYQRLGDKYGYDSQTTRKLAEKYSYISCVTQFLGLLKKYFTVTSELTTFP
jgi:hypothetical protein